VHIERPRCDGGRREFLEATMSTNYWFEHTIDAYLRACAEGRDWRP